MGELKLAGKQVEEGHSEEGTVCSKQRGAVRRPGALRKQKPRGVAGA